ncbi:MAG: hypothetical protein EP335_07705 [Alphaproteobacteria bacterium]|nr:MAG: hypothetical protein EP335_07705 [Alphaproteobacteria bacterium]
MMKSIYALPLVAMLAACASSSPAHYMAADEPGDYGYYESALEQDRYRVAYKARGAKTEEAKDYAMLRAAELTLQHGYDWFEVVDRETEQKRDASHTHVETAMRVGAETYRECGVLTCRTVTRPAYVDPTWVETRHYEPGSTVTFVEIKMGEGPQPNGGNIYDARTISNTIRDRLS